MNPPENQLTYLRSKSDFASEQLSAQENSKRISLLKKLMFSGCILLLGSVIALIIYFNLSTAIDLDSISISSGGLEMTNPVVTGGDKATKYEITAKKAIQSLADPDFIHLKEISAVVNDANNDSFQLNSDEGFFDAKVDNLTLKDNVNIHGSNGYSAYSNSANVDLANDRFESKDYVYVYSQNTTIEAQEAVYNNGNMKFHGGVKVTIQPTEQSEVQ